MKPRPIIPVSQEQIEQYRINLENKKGEVKENNYINNSDKLEFNNFVFGPGTYAQVGNQIEENNLFPPTMAQTASLIHSSFNSNNKFSDKLKDVIKYHWFWCYTGILYVQFKGVYIQDYPQIKNREILMQQNELESKLQSNDTSVRFVPFGYRTGEMTSSELSKNPFVIALAGQEGAEKLAEVASISKHKPYLHSFHLVIKTQKSVSALYFYKEFDGGLSIDALDHGFAQGVAFGVIKNKKNE